MEEVERLTIKVINSGISMVEAVEDGYTAGIRGVGEEFGRVTFSCRNWYLRRNGENILLEEKMPGQRRIGTFVSGYGAGDIMTWKGSCYTCFPQMVLMSLIGMDCPVDKFIDVAIENDADIIGASALLTMTIPELPKIVERMKNAVSVTSLSSLWEEPQ